MVNNAFAELVEEAGILTRGGSEIEQNKYVGPDSTIIRFLTGKDADFSAYFNKIDEDKIINKSLKEKLIDNHKSPAKKRKIFSQLPFQQVFRFCNTFEKLTKDLDFNMTFETNELKKKLYTTLPEFLIIRVTFDKLHLYVPNFIPGPERQVKINDSIEKSFTQSFDCWTTDRKVVNTGFGYQLDVKIFHKGN